MTAAYKVARGFITLFLIGAGGVGSYFYGYVGGFYSFWGCYFLLGFLSWSPLGPFSQYKRSRGRLTCWWLLALWSNVVFLYTLHVHLACQLPCEALWVERKICCPYQEHYEGVAMCQATLEIIVRESGRG